MKVEIFIIYGNFFNRLTIMISKLPVNEVKDMYTNNCFLIFEMLIILIYTY